jgi:hypothetical protein
MRERKILRKPKILKTCQNLTIERKKTSKNKHLKTSQNFTFRARFFADYQQPKTERKSRELRRRQRKSNERTEMGGAFAR